MEGYLGLFLSAFLAATLVPFSSEAVLAGLSAYDRYDPVLLWAVASLGNTLGAILNWGLGRFCLHWQGRRWFPFSAENLDRAQAWFTRYGLWSLLFAWLPIVGDPLTFAAGVLKVNFWIFVGLVFIGKAARYGAVVLTAQAML
jgi:membrane protein YqaA with SNARE-associated domain